jgi:hypothetical protein
MIELNEALEAAKDAGVTKAEALREVETFTGRGNMNQGDMFIVQHLQWYGGDEKYKANEKAFKRVGFIRCRSRKDKDGKYWEVWIGYPFMFKAELQGKDSKEAFRWLTLHGPGEIYVCDVVITKEHWGAGID